MLTTRSSTAAAAPCAPAPQPLGALLALATTGFLCIVTETLPAGLLPQMARGLAVSTAMAGQAVTAYALGSMLAAIPLTVATRGWRRRSVLLSAIAGFFLFNTLTALSSNYGVTLVARVFAGMSAGLAWSLLAGYARRMVPARQQGKALAVAMVGTPVALALGVPLATWLGTVLGWHSAFAMMSVIALALLGWVRVKVPDYPGQARHERMPLRKVFLMPGVRPVLTVVVAWMLAHNMLYTYIAPFAALSGQSDRVDLVLLVFGFAALVAIWVAARVVDRHLRAAIVASLAIFGTLAASLGVLASVPQALYIGVAVWGLTFGGAATFLQTALADAAGDAADVALSMNVVAWNAAIAGGGVAGGVLLDARGARSLPAAMLVLLMIGLFVAVTARRAGFRAGPRHTA